MYWHIDTDIVGLLVMCALYYYSVRMLPGDTYTTQNKAFIRCLRAGLYMTVIDIAASVIMDVPTSRFLYQLLMTAYLLTQVLTVVVWFLYALSILYQDDDVSRRRIAGAALAFYGIYAVLALSNPWSELFFSLGPNLEYARGPLFLPGMIGLYYTYTLALLALILVRRRHIPGGYPAFVLVLQPLLLSIAIPVQLFCPGWLMIYPAYTLCLLLAFLFFQNVRVHSERAQLQQLTEMAEHFTCGMAICKITKDRRLEIQYISGSLATMFEMSPEALQQRFLLDMTSGVHPDDRAILHLRLDEIVQQLNNQEMTYRYITETGKQKWINLSAQTEKHTDGTATVYATYSDLTEQKKAEHLIDMALKNTSVSIWEYDFRRRCIIQLQNSSQMHGFETVIPNVPESLIESGFVHPDSADAFLEMYRKLSEGASFAEGVFKVQTSDRNGYWYEHIRYTNGFDENGVPNRAIGMSTDETEKQVALVKYERELEAKRVAMNEESLIVYALFNLTTDETLEYRYRSEEEVSPEDRVSFVFGRSNPDLLIDEDERARFVALNNKETLLKRFDMGETEFRLEYRRKLNNGIVTWVRNTLHLLRDPRSGDMLLFEYWYDIEHEKMLDLMYRSISANSYDFVARIDGWTRRFEVIATAGLTYHMPPLYGDDADAVTYKLFGDCIAQEDREMVIDNSLIDNVNGYLSQSDRHQFTYRVTYPGGEVRFKRVTQYYIDAQRRIIALLREDVTDVIRVEAEKNRVLSEALAAANQASQAKSRFLTRVSHELRTPLNAILGFLDLSKDADADQIKVYLSNADAAARQLLSIINDVLDVSSIESGKLRISNTPFDFRRLIQEVADLYGPRCRQKGLTFETMLRGSVDDWLVGDYLRVNQILLNLLNNAFKFTERGRISLEVSQRAAQGNKAVIRFTVTDTGCGMSEEMQARLFHPFEQENAATAQKYGGSGLGLSIVGSLVDLMGGSIHAESQLGVGSTFTVNLPFSRCNTGNGLRTLPGAENLRALVVDEDAGRSTYVSAVLTRMGINYTCSDSGKTALAEMQRGADAHDPYTLCLIDNQMREMSGEETTRRIRTRFGSDPIVILLSAFDSARADVSARSAGADMLISRSMLQSTLFDLFAARIDLPTALHEASPADYDLKGMHVLVAEDNAMNRMVVENMLQKKFGVSCDSAMDGQLALDAFLASPAGYYDVILMDIQMPNLDGYETTKQIRASVHPDAGVVQIIALTADAFNEDIAKALASGMNAHIAKPIDPALLGAALAQAYTDRKKR